MKFNNILVVLNPENDKQYALARAVRLVKEQKSEVPVKITVFLAAYDLSYEISALLSLLTYSIVVILKNDKLRGSKI